MCRPRHASSPSRILSSLFFSFFGRRLGDEWSEVLLVVELTVALHASHEHKTRLCIPLLLDFAS